MPGDIRYVTRVALVDALRDDDVFTGVQVEFGWPGDEVQSESVWLRRSEGSLTIPVFMGPDTTAYPVTYDDEFTLSLGVMAGSPGQSAQEAEERGAVLYGGVERVLRTSPLLAVPSLVHAALSHLVNETLPTKEGFAHFIDIEIACKARISGAAT